MQSIPGWEIRKRHVPLSWLVSIPVYWQSDYERYIPGFFYKGWFHWPPTFDFPRSLGPSRKLEGVCF